jgi:two-component system phosphate regulon sensor histidine kinase PhoR
MHERYLGVIGDENKRLGSQVEKVLQMAMIDRKELNLNLKTLNMHELIERAVEKISIQIENKKGDLHLALDAQRNTVIGDETHIMNVILNLLDNAIKYSEDAPNIMIRTQSVRNDFIFSIKDHGVGMNKDALQHIFERFYRVPTGDLHNVKGFGLGLTYVKNIIEELKGKVEVESEPGSGTRFRIKLQIANG